MTFRTSAVAGLACLVLAAPVARAGGAQALAPPGAAPQAIQLKEGDRTVFTIVDGPIPKIVSRSSADPAGARPPQTDNRVETLAAQPGQTNTAAPDTFVATLQNFGPKGAILRVENGYDHPIIYDAVLLKKRGDRVVVERTSICPVGAKGVGTEAWGEPLEGLAIANVRTPPAGDLRCTGPNNLTVAANAPDSNVCVGQTPGSPLAVRLLVDPATGAVRGGAALWTLADAGGPTKGPMIFLEYPMQGDVIGGRPVSLQVVAFASFNPAPTAKTASIALLADGRERMRRPWGLYAQRRMQLATMPAGATPLGFVGVVPFPRTDQNAASDDFAALLAEIGAGQVGSLEVRIEGDDGSVIGRKSYAVTGSPAADHAQVSAALALAKAAAAAPGHCPKPRQQSTVPPGR